MSVSRCPITPGASPLVGFGLMVSFTRLSSGALGLDQKRFVAALGSHLVYRVKPRLSLKLQWDLNSRPYKLVSLGPFTKAWRCFELWGNRSINRPRSH